jgi:hypothetical protein
MKMTSRFKVSRASNFACARTNPRGFFMSDPAVPKRSVAFLRCDATKSIRDDDVSTKADVARSLAAVLGIDYVGDRTGSSGVDESVYWVPSDTLQVAQAAALGIRSADDFFGGAVPYPFVGSKVITHPLIRPGAKAPDGWSHAMGEAMREAALPGFSAFTFDDAKAAGLRVLESDTVRIKMADGVGGAGQSVAHDADELAAQLEAIDVEALRKHGVVLERNLADVATYSVGQVRVGRWLASYVGTQSLTENHRGDEVYGGSTLTVVRGGYSELLRLELAKESRTAVEQALTFHRLAMLSYPALVASRCNYDVAQGVDRQGRWSSGVLEQSWRIGGASGAEIAALSAFRAEPEIRVVRAETREHYGDEIVVPPSATIHFDGLDKHGGRLIKYAQVTPHANP